MGEDSLKLEIRGEILSFPYVWLRDNCHCEYCFHHSAKSRAFDWSSFDVNVKPKDVVQDDKTVQITWNDDHKSQYRLNWLEFRSFTPEKQKIYTETIYRPTKITWSGDKFDEICSKHDYRKILESDDALYNWLRKLSIIGVTLVENTPNDENAVDSIIERIGFVKRSHYGIKYTVQHLVNPSNFAYLKNKLQMHIDLPFYEYCPGLNMLHCLVQTQSNGGQNLITDSNYVANYMKENHSEEFKLLTETEVEWSDVGVENGNEFFKLYRAPVICLDKQGEVARITFSVTQRSTHFPGPIDRVKPWFKAYGLFLELNNRFAARFRNTVGNILVFDNIRIVHGRDAYEDSSNNVRKLIGAYVDWDEVYSRLRCLKVKLDNEDGIGADC